MTSTLTDDFGNIIHQENILQWPGKLPDDYRSYYLFKEEFTTRLHNDQVHIPISPINRVLVSKAHVAIYFSKEELFETLELFDSGKSKEGYYLFNPYQTGYYFAILINQDQTSVKLYEYKNNKITIYKSYQSKELVNPTHFKTYKN